MYRTCRHHPQLLALNHFAVLYADQCDYAEISIIPAVNQQRPQRISNAIWRRQTSDQGFKYIIDAIAGFS